MATAELKSSPVEAFIDCLHACENDQQRIDCVQQNALSLDDLAQYHYFGTNSYGRNLVYHHPEFEVILMCWGPDQQSSAHDHNESLCVMKCIGGELEEQRYKANPTPQPLSKTELSILKAGQSCSITDEEGLHTVGNKTAENACSLHVYFPPISSVSSFSIEDGKEKKLTSAFTSEYGVRIVS